jgi:hypothetical protein
MPSENIVCCNQSMKEDKPRRVTSRKVVTTCTLLMKIICVLLVPFCIRFMLLIRMGVSKRELPLAMLDLPPPPTLHGTGPFPLMLKFHKVAGSTVIETLWRNIQCDSTLGLTQAWRPTLCGLYDTHKNLMFVRGGLPHCTRTPSYLIVTLFRRPLDKLISTLYWYPPYRLRKAAPWTSHIGNWSRHDVVYMISKLSTDRNPALQPPLQEYTAVLGGGFAHSEGSERRQWKQNAGAPSGLSGAAAARKEKSFETTSDPLSRRRAIERLRKDPLLVVGITERLDASMVLVALRLGWSLESMQYESKKSTANLAPTDPRFNVTAGKYHLARKDTADYMRYLMRDDERVYAEAVKTHERQASQFSDFKVKVSEFKQILQRANGRAPPSCTAAVGA